jgi:hypothetical protein
MGWTFKVHGAVAAALGAMLLTSTALTWLPGTLPLTRSKWPMGVAVVLLIPIFTSALVRTLLARADRHTMWLAFRCIPRTAQISLAVLAISGVVMTAFDMAWEGHLQSAEMKGNRYFAFDTTPYARGTVEISRDQYFAVLEGDQRSMLAIPGLLFVGAAYFVLAAGQLHRVDRDAASSARV